MFMGFNVHFYIIREDNEVVLKGPAGYAPFLEMVKHQDDEVRSKAVWTIAILASNDGIPLFILSLFLSISFFSLLMLYYRESNGSDKADWVGCHHGFNQRRRGRGSVWRSHSSWKLGIIK